ncbi:MAG TPA: acyl carrier protein [Gemmatimonadetes bacterium]|nr:acyl carrier protein [Gemmatimonadota bacterium]
MTGYEYLAKALSETYGVQEATIAPTATPMELGLDSLTVVELLFDAEDEFEIEVPEDRTGFETLGEAGEIIDELVAAKEH